MRRRHLLASLPAALLPGCAPAPSAPPRYVVFFTEDSAAMDETGEAIAREAAAAAKARPTAPVQVRGFAAPEGSAATFGRALAETRARHVADHLVASGVPRPRIVVEPRAAVPFESFPTESRRVEIIIGP